MNLLLRTEYKLESEYSQTELFFREYIQRFLSDNEAGCYLEKVLSETGIGLMPLIDHCTIRTLDVDTRAKIFISLGFIQDEKIGILEFDSWWAKVYRKPGYPSLFLDQAFEGSRGEPSLIPDWVNTFGDQCFHHIAISVQDIENAIDKMKSRDIKFADKIVGELNTDLRQIFTQPEIKLGKAFTVLELIERHNGYQGFLPPQADGLMNSTRL